MTVEQASKLKIGDFIHENGCDGLDEIDDLSSQCAKIVWPSEIEYLSLEDVARWAVMTKVNFS